MSDVFAKAGEPVTTRDGKVICYVKNDLVRFHVVMAEDFHRFADGETRWATNQEMDPRCTRPNASGFGMQICINGEWRP